MLAPDPLPPARLVVICRVVRAMTALGAAALVGLPLMFWFVPEWPRSWAGALAQLPHDRLALTDAAMRHAGFATLVPVALGLFALLQLWRLFGDYAAGLALTQRAQAHLRRFAWALLAAALLQPVYRAAMSVLFTLDNPPGQRLLVVNLSSDDYVLVLLGAVLLAISAVMSEAVRAADENRGFV